MIGKNDPILTEFKDMAPAKKRRINQFKEKQEESFISDNKKRQEKGFNDIPDEEFIYIDQDDEKKTIEKQKMKFQSVVYNSKKSYAREIKKQS